MVMTDPISDMLTRIRNANLLRKEAVIVPHSVLKTRIAEILKDEGFITSFDVMGSGKREIVISLKYAEGNIRVINGLKRISKPGLRVTAAVDKLPKVLKGLGIAIVSTPKGVLTDKQARAQNVGGEVLAYVW